MTSSAPDSFNLAQHCLGRQAAERGAQTALILCDGPSAFRSWTYGELDLMVRKLARGLIERGLKKGDRVMIRAENDIDFVLSLLCDGRHRLRRAAGVAALDRARGAGAGRGFGRGGDLSWEPDPRRAQALFAS